MFPVPTWRLALIAASLSVVVVVVAPANAAAALSLLVGANLVLGVVAVGDFFATLKPSRLEVRRASCSPRPPKVARHLWCGG